MNTHPVRHHLAAMIAGREDAVVLTEPITTAESSQGNRMLQTSLGSWCKEKNNNIETQHTDRPQLSSIENTSLDMHDTVLLQINTIAHIKK